MPPERWLLGLAASIVLALVAASCLRLQAIPEPLRYVPTGSEAYIVSGRLDELWRAAEPHLTPYFEVPADDMPADDSNSDGGQLAQSARALKSDLEKKGILLSKAEHLAGVGVDAGRPAAAAWVRSEFGKHWLVVLPLFDGARLTSSLERFLGETSIEVLFAERTVRRIAQTWVAFTDDGWAVLSNDENLVWRSVLGGEYRLDDWRSNDRIVQAFAAPLPPTAGPPLATLHGKVRTPVSDVHFAAAIDNVTFAFNGRTLLPRARSQFLTDLLRAEAEGSPDGTLARSDLALSVASVALPRLLRTLLTLLESTSTAPFGGPFAPVLQELQRGEGVRRVSIAVSDTRQRVPGVMLGVQISARDADAFILRLQSSLRATRDNQILRSVASNHRQQQAGEATPDIAALLQSGEIELEREALWLRYRWKGDTVVANPPFAAQDFSGDTYARTTADGLALRYLMPPFTANDLKHRFAAEREELQVEDLLADRYRLCSAYYEETLWIGNDAPMLIDWITRVSKEPPSSTYTEVTSFTPGVVRAKALALAQPARLLEAAQLYPDNDVNQLARQDFSDLSPYGAVLIGMEAAANEQELNVWATFRRR